MGGEAPAVSEGIDDAGVAVAPELVGRGLDFGRAFGERPPVHRVHIGHIEVDGGAGAAEGLRRDETLRARHPGELLGEVDLRPEVPALFFGDAEFRVHHRVVRAVHDGLDPGAEHLLVPGEGGASVVDDQVGRNRPGAGGDVVAGLGHGVVPFWREDGQFLHGFLKSSTQLNTRITSLSVTTPKRRRKSAVRWVSVQGSS